MTNAGNAVANEVVYHDVCWVKAMREAPNLFCNR